MGQSGLPPELDSYLHGGIGVWVETPLLYGGEADVTHYVVPRLDHSFHPASTYP